MSRYVLSARPPDGWDEACESGGRLFPSTAWQRLLEESFGCMTAYAWDDDQQRGAAFSIFKAGPFRVAYLGFPVGAFIGSIVDYDGLLSSWRSPPNIATPVCIRIPVSSPSPAPQLPLPAARTPETASADLGSWSLQSASKNIRRDIIKAQRAGLECGHAANEKDAAAIYRLYESTIRLNRGAMRYTPAYFRQLVRLSSQQDNLRVLVARRDGQIVAFNASVLDGTRGSYLHGGMDREARDHRPGTFLMNEAIRLIREAGGESFNFLSSPVDQQSLVQYKEKWGSTTRRSLHHTARLEVAYPLFRAAEWVYRRVADR